MNAPSNANTSGLYLLMKRGLYYRPDAMGYTGIKDHAGRYSKEDAEDHFDPASGVTMVSEAEAAEFSPNCFDDLARAHLLKQRDAAEARADRLAKFGQHTNWELSFCYLDGEEEDGCWAVHSVNGGRNDREWILIGRGETPDDAIRAALQQETQP